MHEETHHTLIYFLYKLGIIPEGIPEIVPISFLLITFLGIFSYIATKNLKIIPLKMQVALEMIVSGFNNFVKQIIGKDGEKYAPLIGSFFICIFLMNLVGLVPGMIAPTSSLNTTIALALVSILSVQYFGIRKHGFLKYLLHFTGSPWWMSPIMLPVHIISELAKPFSLSIRLFANIFGKEKSIYMLIFFLPVLVKYIVPIPIVIPTYFLMLVISLVICVLQALIFSLLSTVYISVMLGDEHH